ncbi:hypothetical protein ACTWQF_32445 [Streptomyces sp. 8N114]|uniref:hypothetical protein n=1 Tax=Streptomyces sp. 8N114 TaxID=3457419 RepID=UPI003FD61BA3
MPAPAATAVMCSTTATARFSGSTTPVGWASATNSVNGSFQPLQANSEPDPSQHTASGSRRGSRAGRPRTSVQQAAEAASAQHAPTPVSREPSVFRSAGRAIPRVPPADQYSQISPTTAARAGAQSGTARGRAPFPAPFPSSSPSSSPSRPANASGQRRRR